MTKRQYLQVATRQKADALIGVVVLAYACCYVGRLNYSAAMAQMLVQGVLTKEQGGMISTAFFVCYGVGQLINGYVSDRTDAVKQVALGIFGSAALNLLMSRLTTFAPMLLTWSVNGYLQSLVWTPAFLVTSQSIPRKWNGHALMYLNMAPPLGTMLSFLISGLILRVAEWKQTFTGGCVVMFVVGVFWLAATSYLYKDAVRSEKDDIAQEEVKEKRVSIARLLMMSGVIFLVIPTILHGMLRDGITNWLPTYLSEMFRMSAETAVISSVALPLINAFGTVGAYRVLHRTGNEFTCMAALFALASLMLTVLIVAGRHSVVLTILMLALVTACMMGVNTMICSEIASHFARFGRAGGVSGFFDAAGYAGTAVSMYVIAIISDRHGWEATQWIWLCAAVLAMVLCLLGLGRWMRFRRPARTKDLPFRKSSLKISKKQA